MGNLLRGSSRRRVESSINKDIKTSKLKRRKTLNRIHLIKTKNKLKPVSSENILFAPRDMQEREQQPADRNDDNFGLTPLTPRNIDVNRFATSERRQNDNSHNIGNEIEKSEQRYCQATNTDQQPYHSPRNDKRQNHATLGTNDDQDSQITTVGTATNVIQTVHHTHYNIQVEINSPSTDAIVIGNDSTVNINKKDRTRQLLVDHFEMENTVTKYVRKPMDESSLTHQKSDKTVEAIQTDVTEKVVGNIGSKKSKHKLKRSTSADTDPYLFRRSKSNRKLKKRAYTLDSRNILRNFQWTQYELVQESLLRTVSCKIKKCESVDRLTKKIEEIKTELKNLVEQPLPRLKKQLKKSLGKTRHENDQHQITERIISGFNDNSKLVLSDAYNTLSKLKERRIQDLNSKPSCTPHDKEFASERDKMTSHDVAKKIMSLISEKVISYVSTLLPLQIQQEIITFTFECQKSFVLKQLMIDFFSCNFSIIMKYILNPNEFAKNWLISFTNQKIFHKKSPEKMHIYAKIAKNEVEHTFDEIKTAMIASTKDGMSATDNLSDWSKSFLHHIQKFNSVPFSSRDIDDLQLPSNIYVKELNEILNSNLEGIKNETIEHFKNTTVNNVKWREDPYNKIIECLWGCTECCPFCHEPCQYSDKEHVVQGNNHKCIQHRPLGLYGFMNEENNMIMLNSCNRLVRSPDEHFRHKHEYISEKCRTYYQSLFNGWEIRPFVDGNECQYWKYIMCRWKDQLQQFYGANTNDIDDEEWKSITVEDAVRSLNEIYICS